MNRTFRNHLNTLHLNRLPKTYDKPRRTPIDRNGRAVLVVDDICTSGRSLDVARALIAAAGGNAILFSWLKTISAAFMHMTGSPVAQPFMAATFSAEPPAKAYPYGDHIVDPAAPGEIDKLLAAFRAWKWP